MSLSSADELLRLTARLNRWASARAAFTVPTAQARLLGHIDDLQPVRITALAQADHSSQPGVTAQVNRMEASGLVRRVVDDSDARASLVELTEQGSAALAVTRASRASGLTPHLEELTPEQLDDLHRGLRVISHLVENLGTPTITTPVQQKD